MPGELEQGELIRRITSTDADVVMPPPSHNKPLSAKQIESLRQWIKDGAKYESHWAFTAPRKLTLPDVGTAQPIDAFVVSRLKDRGSDRCRRPLPRRPCVGDCISI